jgi:hypothetical protein
MLHSIKQLQGTKLGASDGVIGQLKDFYFDDRNWVVRYLVADTGNWLPGRKVLLTPHALDRLDPAGDLLSVRLTRKQIEDSPSMESHKPVSRQYEESTVFVALTGEDIEQRSAHLSATAITAP